MRDIQAFINQVNREYKNIWVGDEADTLADQDRPIGFSCPVCNEVYPTREEAEECRDQPYDNAGLKIGDIVVVPGAHHGRFDPDDPWIAFSIPGNAESENHFDQTGYKVPFYVVTAIHDAFKHCHRCLVTLASLCGNCLQIGWNPADGDGHYALYRLDGKRHCVVGKNTYWLDQIDSLLNECIIPDQVREEAAVLATLGISTRNLL